MSRGGGAIDVQVLGRGARGPLAAAGVRRLLRGAAARVGAPRGEVAVVWTGDATIRDLNRRFRGQDRATDVLSFPDGAPGPGGGPRIGDIVISVPAARRNAARDGLDLRTATQRLLLHGFLHLLGYDHEVDGGEMEALEARLRRDLARKAGRPARGLRRRAREGAA